MNNQSFILYLALEGDENTKEKLPVSQMGSGIYIVIPVALLVIIGILIYLAYLHRKRNSYLYFHIIANEKKIPSEKYSN